MRRAALLGGEIDVLRVRRPARRVRLEIHDAVRLIGAPPDAGHAIRSSEPPCDSFFSMIIAVPKVRSDSRNCPSGEYESELHT